MNKVIQPNTWKTNIENVNWTQWHIEWQKEGYGWWDWLPAWLARSKSFAAVDWFLVTVLFVSQWGSGQGVLLILRYYELGLSFCLKKSICVTFDPIELALWKDESFTFPKVSVSGSYLRKLTSNKRILLE